MERRVVRNTQEDALDKFERKFSFPKKPAPELPDLPSNLDDLPDSDFMGVYSEFIAWVSYTKSELVKAEIEEDRAESAKRFVEAEVLIEQWGADAKSSDRVTVAKARRDVDFRVVKCQDKYLQARAYRKLVEAVFDRCDRAAQLLSRELTRRTSTSPRDSRAARYNT